MSTNPDSVTFSLSENHIQAPFSAEQVQRLNEFQTGTGGGLPGHPFTCGHRSDPPHGQEGGDTGVLIATEGGWVCPHCDYIQDWAHATMAMADDVARYSQEPFAALFATHVSGNLAARLLAYEALAAEGRLGAETMVRCLRVRQNELAKGESTGESRAH